MLPSGWLRLTRLLRAAGVMLVLALGAHVLAHGAPPPPAAALIALIACAQAAFLLTVRHRSLPTHVASMAGVQLGLHAFFVATAHGGPHAVAPGAWMLAAHSAGTVVAAWWLRQGDRRAAALAGAVWRVLLPLLPAPTGAPVHSSGAIEVEPTLPASRVPASVYRRRGPPAMAPVCMPAAP